MKVSGKRTENTKKIVDKVKTYLILRSYIAMLQMKFVSRQTKYLYKW